MSRRERWSPLPETYQHRPPFEALRRFVADLEPKKLVELVLAHAEGDEGLRRALELEMAARQASPAISLLRQMIVDSFALRDFVEYRDAGSFVQGLQPILNTLERLLGEGEAAAVVELAESALAAGDEFLNQIDDSDAHLAMFLEQLEEIHLRACQAARPDPVALARRLFAAETESGFGLFSDSYLTYFEVLGPEGRAAFRQQAEAIWDLLPALRPHQERADFSTSRWQISHMMQIIAEASGNLDAKVAVLTKDLSTASNFLRVAETYLDADRPEEALEWAERGVQAFPKRTDSRLRAFLAGLYHSSARHDEAMELIWANFVDHPGLGEYHVLHEHAQRSEAGPDWRKKALDWLTPLAQKEGTRGRGSYPESIYHSGAACVLVQIHLQAGATETAWETARTFGCTRELWRVLAKAREEEHPDEALALYTWQTETALETAHERNYEEAVARLQDMRRVLSRTGQVQELADYVATLRFENKRRPNFIKKLNVAGLP